MNKSLSRFIFLLLLIPACQANSQVSFTLEPGSVYAVKPMTNFVMYDFAQFENLTGDTLAMRWVKTAVAASVTGGHGGSKDLGNWVLGIQDPQSFFLPANDLDSADFFLPPVTSSTDKFILQLYPNNQPGKLLVTFKIFPIDHPADSTHLTFDYTATQVTNSTEAGLSAGLTLYPNPTSGWTMLTNTFYKELDVKLSTPLGECLESWTLHPGKPISVDCRRLSPGVYIVAASDGEHSFALPLLVQ